MDMHKYALLGTPAIATDPSHVHAKQACHRWRHVACTSALPKADAPLSCTSFAPHCGLRLLAGAAPQHSPAPESSKPQLNPSPTAIDV